MLNVPTPIFSKIRYYRGVDTQKRNFLFLILGAVATVALLFFVAQSSLNEAARDEQLRQEKKDASDKETFARIPVVYASRDIHKGSEFKSDMLEQMEELKSRVPAGAISNKQELMGGVAAYEIQQGQIILKHSVLYLSKKHPSDQVDLRQ